MPRLSTPHELRPTKGAGQKERAARKAAERRAQEIKESQAAADARADEYIRTGSIPMPVRNNGASKPTEPPPATGNDGVADPETKDTEIAQLKASAARIIASKNVLDLFAAEFGKVIAGEKTNGKLLYLVSTSRLFDKTMHAAIKGTSAGGKSEIRKRMLEFFPPESVVSFTSLSEKSLIYHDGDFSHKILSMGEAAATEEQEFQDYLLRELMSEGRLRHATVQRVGNANVSMTIEKEGPVSFLVTTTKSKMHPENETRMLSLEIDDSEEQTRKVMTKVAQVEGLNQAATQVNVTPWQDYQRWLERGERRVHVPFADTMVDLAPAASVRLRRDIGQVLRAIKAHALLHREHRKHDADGRIIADIENDYRVVRELMNSLLAEGSGVAVSKAMLETIEAVRAATAEMAEAEGASAQDIALKLKLDKSAAWRRLSSARNEGFIVNLEPRKGMPGKYREAKQENVKPIVILPTVEEVQESRASGSVSPQTVQPCNRDGKLDSYQEDDGYTDGCKWVDHCATDTNDTNGAGATDNRDATADATIKSMNGKAESLPVAGLQSFPKDGAGLDPSRCLQCGGDIGPGGRGITIRSTGAGAELATVHEDCLHRWLRKGPAT
jgi:hypothetical protein